jgi:hypothetical protein
MATTQTIPDQATIEKTFAAVANDSLRIRRNRIVNRFEVVDIETGEVLIDGFKNQGEAKQMLAVMRGMADERIMGRLQEAWPMNPEAVIQKEITQNKISAAAIKSSAMPRKRSARPAGKNI